MNLYIHSAGRLERDQNSLVYRTLDGRKIHIPSKTTDALFLFGQTEFNTSTIWLLAKEKIPCHVFSWTGNHVSTITPHPQQVSGTLAIKQGQAYRSKGKRIAICQALIESAAHNMMSNHRRNDLPNLSEMEAMKERISQTKRPDELMGIEGNIRKIYYQGWQQWMQLKSPFQRCYHPPDNPINALVSFLNSLLYATVVSELYRTALHPGIAYLHEPQSRRYSLALDLSEITKPVIVDRTLASMWNNKEIKDTDFEPNSNGVILKEDARKRVVKTWDEVIRRTFYSHELKRNISYRGIIRRDCYKIIRFLLEKTPLNFFKIQY